MSETFAIVGASLAGGSAAVTLREEGFDGRVVLIGQEQHPPYERPPLSKEYFRGEQPFEDSLVRPAAFYADNEIDTRFGVTALRVDPIKRVIHLSEGGHVSYDKVLIAAVSPESFVGGTTFLTICAAWHAVAFIGTQEPGGPAPAPHLLMRGSRAVDPSRPMNDGSLAAR